MESRCKVAEAEAGEPENKGEEVEETERVKEKGSPKSGRTYSRDRKDPRRERMGGKVFFQTLTLPPKDRDKRFSFDPA